MVLGEPTSLLVGPFEGRKPESFFDSAECLRRCKSTPDLSFTAVSLLSKTLTARATRLESMANRARLAAEKEAYRRMTIARRRRALGPKNASEFMRQTLRDRDKARESNKVEVERRTTGMSLLVESRPSSGILVRAAQRDMSKPALDLLFRESTHALDPDHFLLTPADSPQACGSRDGSPADRKEQHPTRQPSAMSQPDRVCLEDDSDIRALLDKTQSSCSCTSPKGMPRPATSCGRLPGKMSSASCGTFDRSRGCVEPPLTVGSSSVRAHNTLVRRPHTAGAHRRDISRKTGLSDVVQLRREMLIRSHGEGRNVYLFAADPFETTAMGRKKCCKQTGLMPWMPANTLAGLDRVERSRMLMNQRPVVSKLRSWA